MDPDAELEDETRDEPDPDGAPAWDLDVEPVRHAFLPPAPPPADGVAWAELPLRAGALLIDFAIAGVATQLVGRVASWLFESFVFPQIGDPGSQGTTQVIRAASLLLPTAITWALLIGSATYLWRVFRATPGQMALGLFTVGEDGRRLTVERAAVRFVVLALAWLLTTAVGVVSSMSMVMDPEGGRGWYDAENLVMLVGPLAWYALLTLTIARDPRGQGLHDKVAHSVVVRRSGPPS